MFILKQCMSSWVDRHQCSRLICCVYRIVSLHCNRNAGNVLCESSLTQPLRHAAYCCWIQQGQMPLPTMSHVCPCEWGPRRVQGWLLAARNFVNHFACRLSHWHFPTQTCGIAWRSVAWVSHDCLPYTFIGCRWISAADTLLSHKQRITPWNSKRDQFSKWVTMLQLPQLCCARLAHDLNHTAVNTGTLCHLYEHHLNFQWALWGQE
jgi:hypothetical protein